MNNPFSRTPFARLLIPAIAAILATTFADHFIEPVTLLITGTLIVAISYLIPPKYNFGLRWVFGFGISITIFAIFSYQTQLKNKQSYFDFAKEKVEYLAVVENIPQEKERSFACDLSIIYPQPKKIVAYFQKDNESASLQPGQELFINATVDSFRNFGNPDDFDYVRYMKNKGFAGTAYIPSKEWIATGKTHTGLKNTALHIRMKVNEFYKNFELTTDQQAFISALTLGHKQDLTNELKEAFRASGTAHVLAVSGLHVGIIYAAFAFLFSFFPNRKKLLIIRQILIIIALWAYALLTGLSPSVVRATIMLTIVSVGIIFNKTGFTYNTLFTTAFILLIVNPFYLYDIGFQMSFGAVLSILYFNPKINAVYEPKNKIMKYIWSLLTVSTSAQIGVFPVALYYFGSFPTYFFIANLIVVPMIGFVIYAILPTALAVFLKNSGLLIFDYLFDFFKWMLQTFINIVLSAVYFIESLPFAQLSEIHISLPQMFILITFIIILFIFVKQKRAFQLIMLLSCILFFTVSMTHANYKSKKTAFVVYNTPNISDFGFYHNKKRIYRDIAPNGVIPIKDKRILVLSENILKNHMIADKMKLDVLVLCADKTFVISELNELFEIKTIVLDNSVAQNVKRKWISECERLNIAVHDVAQKGAFIIKM